MTTTNLPDAFGFGVTELMMAASQGNLQRVKELIEKGANPKQQDNDELNVFDHAFDHDQQAILQFLVNGDYISLDEKDEIGNTRLHYACDELANVKKLLDLGANPNLKNNKGETPLIIAAKSDNIYIIHELIYKKAEIDHVDNYGYSVIDWCTSNGQYELVKDLEYDLQWQR